jgi:hypothetical protein
MVLFQASGSKLNRAGGGQIRQTNILWMMGYDTGIVNGHKLVLHVCVGKDVVQMLHQNF